MRKVALILVFAFGLIAGVSAVYALHLYDTKPLVIKEETRVLGPDKYLEASKVRVPEGIYERVSPGIVTIRSLFYRAGEDSKADLTQGSGVVLDTQGYIVTNLHVLLLDPFSAGRKTADEVYVDFSDGTVASAEIIGQDPNADLALIKIKPEPETKLVPVKIANSDLVKPGQAVVAIGAPFGERGSVSFGVVSSTNRSIDSLVGNFSINGAIQTDAAINHGNSGGPLLNMDGQVIGINSQIRTDPSSQGMGGNEGVAYAIPSKLVMNLLPRLKKGGVLSYAYLGVQTREVTEQLARIFKLPTKNGLLVQVVNDGSPAQISGIQAPKAAETFFGEQIGIGGDIILAVEGVKMKRADDLAQAIAKYSPGQKITITVQNSTKGSKPKNLTVLIAAREQAGS